MNKSQLLIVTCMFYQLRLIHVLILINVSVPPLQQGMSDDDF